MSIENHEIPPTQLGGKGRIEKAGGAELDPDDITMANRPVYMLTIGALGLALIIGLIGWIVLAAVDKKMPEGATVLIGTIGGALVGLLTSAPKKK